MCVQVTCLKEKLFPFLCPVFVVVVLCQACMGVYLLAFSDP